MKPVVAAVLALGALYLTIWPHELGHSLAAYLCGCKANWWQTDVSWFLWGSWGGAIDYPCLQAQQGPGLFLTDFAGIVVNLVLLSVAPVLGSWWDPKAPAWRFLPTVFWALANYAEAFSYLVLNTLWLKSDMETVVVTTGLSRWVWCAAGFCLAVVAGRALSGPVGRAASLLATPRLRAAAWRWALVFYVLVTGLAMGAARVVLT